jgi:hypothetical protein
MVVVPGMDIIVDDWVSSQACAARECVAYLRMEAGRRPCDPVLPALVGELSVRDPDFRTWWANHLVRGLHRSPAPHPVRRCAFFSSGPPAPRTRQTAADARCRAALAVLALDL